MTITTEMLKANPELATQDNFKKANKKKWWDVRRFMKRVNPALKSN